MNLFSPDEPRLSLTDISQRLRMPKSTTYNLLNTLVSVNYLERVEGELYALGTAIIGLTPNVRVNVELRDRAAPFLRKLADNTGESVYLTIRDGDHALYIYAIESSGRLLARTAVGVRAPLYCTSVGKAMLAFLPPDEVDTLYQEAGLTAYTDNTLTDLAALHDDLRAVRERGFSIDNQEHELNTYCLGAPLFDARSQIIGSCSVSGVSPDIIGERLPVLSAQLLQTAQEISRHMGHIPARNTLIRNRVTT
jgi:DNA-binding IclR family transcriptional regulator